MHMGVSQFVVGGGMLVEKEIVVYWCWYWSGLDGVCGGPDGNTHKIRSIGAWANATMGPLALSSSVPT